MGTRLRKVWCSEKPLIVLSREKQRAKDLRQVGRRPRDATGALSLHIILGTRGGTQEKMSPTAKATQAVGISCGLDDPTLHRLTHRGKAGLFSPWNSMDLRPEGISAGDDPGPQWAPETPGGIKSCSFLSYIHKTMTRFRLQVKHSTGNTS